MKIQHVAFGFLHWCPGCNQTHTIPSGVAPGKGWSFDGNGASPTITPPVRLAWLGGYGGEGAKLCRYSITAGQLIFGADSTHSLAGQTIALSDIP